MRIKVVFASLLILLLLSAFVPQPAPLFAIALPEGRTLDEGHDSGYIDWSGGVNYADLFHRDGICPSGCTENVTQISSGGMVSGVFAGDVSYFEVMLAYSGAGGFGTATIQACSSSYSVYLGIGGATPGFNSFPLSVPSGCTSWSVSASGGVVYFRSVDANYSYIPPTSTFTPSPTPTDTETPTPTPTETLMPTATETETSTPTSTSTETLTPTPSDTPTPSNTPVPSSNNDDDSDSSSSDSGWQLPAIPFAWFPSATPKPTATQMLAVQSVPTTIPRTSTPVRASTVTPTLSSVILPTEPLACTPSAGSDFPWWLLPAGMTIASALSLLSSFLKNIDTASVTLGDLSFSPFGVSVPIPHRVPHKTTVGEWVMRPIRTMVSVMRTVWRTVTEAVARFVTRTRQVIDRIVHSEWVTTFKQVSKTFWEKVTEKVPLLGWLGKVIGFIWKTVIKPVIRWITEAIRTLRTWVENVIRWIVEKIQDGWNYITKQVSETIREWVEKTDWVRDWVTKEITVWETVWENKFYAFPIPLGGGGGKLAAPAQQTWSKVLAQLGLTVTLGTLAVTLQQCPALPTPTCTPTPATNLTVAYIQTQSVGTVFSGATQTAMAGTPSFPSAAATAVTSPFVDIWNTNTHASDGIIDDMITWEGNKEFPYNDSTNNCTVGIGHKLHDGPCSPQELSTKYTPEQIREWFKQDLAEAESDVRAMFQTLDNEFRPGQPEGNPFPITQAQFDALVSFTFNAGAGRLVELVRLTIKPDTGSFDFEKFSELMLDDYAKGGPGLLPRRQAEVNLFVNGVYP